MKTHSIAKRQGGAFLLEALVAILVISFGILGIVGLQARSLAAVGDAQYRGEAAFYAQSLAGRMWAHDPTDVADLLRHRRYRLYQLEQPGHRRRLGLAGRRHRRSRSPICNRPTASWRSSRSRGRRPTTMRRTPTVTEAVVGNNVAP